MDLVLKTSFVRVIAHANGEFYSCNFSFAAYIEKPNFDLTSSVVNNWQLLISLLTSKNKCAESNARVQVDDRTSTINEVGNKEALATAC